MAANQQTPEERFDAWIQSRFAWAQPGTYNIIPGSQTQIPNCFAYAVGVRNRAILAYMWDDLAREYGNLGYLVTTDPVIMDGDVEVYVKPSDPNRPVHAHCITSAASQTCESKMGADFAIQHHQSLLQCTRSTSNRMEYGTTVARYRYNEAAHRAWLEGEITSSTGRKLKRTDVSYTTSGRPVAKSKAAVTKSGRVVKKGSRGSKGGIKANREPRPYRVSGRPDPRVLVLASHRSPVPPRGGFRRPTVGLSAVAKSFARPAARPPVARPAPIR